MALSRGIDVSHHQSVVDWRQLRADHRLTWGACKATEGTRFVDGQFARNWKNLRATGLVRVAYHFARPGRSSATAQAARFLDVVDPVEGDVLCLDLEQSDHRNQAQVNAWAREFGEQLRAHTRCTTVAYLGGYSRNGSGRGLSAWFDYWWYPRYATMRPVTRWPRAYRPRLSGNTTGWASPAVWQWAASLRTREGQVDANVSPLTAEQLRDGPGGRPRGVGPAGQDAGTEGPDGPDGEGDEMPTELSRVWSGQRELRPGAWVPLLMNTVDKTGAPSVASGPLAVTGELGVYLEGVRPGSQIQLRPYLVEHVDGRWVQSRSLGMVEVTATPGTTFCRVPVTCRIPEGQRLRLKANAAGRAVRTFANLLTWKG